MADHEELSQSFGAAADTYESARPSYPAAAVAWLIEPAREAGRAVRVADVGAGTGKLTRVLTGLGAEVVAVEPDAEMLSVLRTAVPGVPTFVGTAEDTRLPDASVDAVVLGQAWHWVDVERASAEAGRVLRPGGVLGLVWNIRDESVPWVSRLTTAMHGSAAERLLSTDGVRVAAPFEELEEQHWRWSRTMKRSSLFDLAHSRSYVITATPAERERVDRELAELCDDLGAVDDVTFELPYVTRAFRSVRG